MARPKITDIKYRLDTKDTTLDMKITADEGVLTNFYQNQVF